MWEEGDAPLLVNVAIYTWLAGNLQHDLVLEEDSCTLCPDAVHAGLPFAGACSAAGAVGARCVPHDSRGVQHHACAVRPLHMIQLGAVLRVVCSVEDLVVRTQQANTGHPVPSLVDPVGVGLIAGVGVQASGKVKKSSIGRRVLVVVTVVEGENLPSQSSTASRRVPSNSLGVEDGGSDRDPSGSPRRRVGILVLGRGHDSKSPENLVVISFGLSLVRGHVVVSVRELEDEGLGGDVVVLVVAGVVPVVDESTEHAAGFPPVVWVTEQTWDAAGFVAGVEGDHLLGDGGGRLFDRVCEEA